MTEDQELLQMAYNHWARGKNQKLQMAEMFMMITHLVGTVQYILEHFGLTELPGSAIVADTVGSVDSAVAGANGIDLADPELVKHDDKS